MKIQTKLPFKTKSLKDMSPIEFVPHTNYVGNFNPFPHKRILEIVKFIKPYCERYIVTAEGAEPSKAEHVHFWLSDINKPIESIKKQLTRLFPELKRQGRGGARKWELKPAKKEIQLHYIFKEQTKNNYLKTIHSNIPCYKDFNIIQNHINEYTKLQELDNQGQDSKFLAHLYAIHGPTTNIKKIVQIYAAYALKNNLKRINKWSMLNAVNYVLLRTDMTNLVQSWAEFAESQISYHGLKVDFN